MKIKINNYYKNEFDVVSKLLSDNVITVATDEKTSTYIITFNEKNWSNESIAKKVLKQYRPKPSIVPLVLMCGLAFLLLTVFIIMMVINKGHFDLLTYFLSLCLPAIILILLSTLYCANYFKSFDPKNRYSIEDIKSLIKNK